MNDRHPSGTMAAPAPASEAASAHFASFGTQEAQYGDFTTHHSYGATGLDTPGSGTPGFDSPGFDTTGFDPTGLATGSHSTATFEADPLFGSLPGQHTDSYDTHWSTGGQQTLNYDAYAAQHHGAYDSGAYDTTSWTAGNQHLPLVPSQAASPESTGQWDAGAWLQPDQSGSPADQTQQWEWGTQVFDTGAYDATQWNSDGATPTPDAYEPLGETFDQTPDPQATAAFEQVSYDGPAPDDGEFGTIDDVPEADPPLLDEQEEVAPGPPPRAASRGGARSRRRAPAKRSALLTVAVPSACVMGVAGIAAASVSTLSGGDQDSAASASDAQPLKASAANSKLDTQLESLSAGADDFADRASRTQERIDLKAQQLAEQKRAAAEAARKERLRPKYALPVARLGLSAYYGQSGINWMSVHTGIDFPVSYGTTVMAATDGVVRTQYNSAYGNMMIVTAKDGTETWYCHLSSYIVSSGTAVKAGQPIANSGNSGNSTGPHLHFEVRPGGGSAIDPLAWLRSHGLDPS